MTLANTGRGATLNANVIIGATTGANFTVGTLTLGEYVNSTTAGYYNAAMVGNGAFTLNNPAGIVNATNIILAANTSTVNTGYGMNINGTLNLTAGQLNAGTIQLGPQGGLAAVTTAFNWTNGTVGNLPGNNLTITNLTLNLASANPHVFSVSSGQNGYIYAPLTNTGGLTVSGGGTLTLYSDNTYSGGTTVSAGTLALGASGSIASSTNLTIASGATFDVSAQASGMTFTGSSPQQTLAGSSTSGAATINAPGKTVTLNSGAMLSFQADGIGGTVGNISVAGNLTLNANAITVNVTGNPLPLGNYTLLSCTGTLVNNGTFAAPTFTGFKLWQWQLPSLSTPAAAAASYCMSPPLGSFQFTP